MADINILEQFRPWLVKVREADELSFNALQSALRDTSPSIARTSFIEQLVSRVPDLQPFEVRGIINALLWLISGRSHLELPAREFAERVSRSPDLELSQEDREVLAERLATLLDMKSLQFTWKAIDVLTEHEKIFIDARVVTDVRPIFGDDVKELPDTVVVVQMLKIRYRIANRTEEFFVALDTKDVGELRGVLDRAEAKAKTVESLLQTAGLAYLEVE